MTEQKTFPQYAKSTSAEVIEAIKAQQEQEKRLFRSFGEFATLHGINNPRGEHYASRWGYFYLSAIVSEGAPTNGRWKRGPRGQGWVPYANNPLAKEMEALGEVRLEVPGLPGSLMGQNYMATTRGFIWEGEAFTGVSFRPDNAFPEGSTWEEILASEFHAAMEGFNAQIEEGKIK